MTEKQWATTREEEDEYRRKLLSHARKGDVKAQRELMEKYGMRIYSETERSKMPPYYDSGKKGSPPSLTSPSLESAKRGLASSKGTGKLHSQSPKAQKMTRRPKNKNK